MNNNHLNKEEIAQMYNEMHEIWPDDDKWYSYTHNCIVKYINSQKELMNLSDESLILPKKKLNIAKTLLFLLPKIHLLMIIFLMEGFV